jgi:hypothetical protein
MVALKTFFEGSLKRLIKTNFYILLKTALVHLYLRKILVFLLSRSVWLPNSFDKFCHVALLLKTVLKEIVSLPFLPKDKVLIASTTSLNVIFISLKILYICFYV